MKILFAVAALLWVHVPNTAAQSSKLLQALNDLSPCAITCFTGAVSRSTCTLLDTSCMCTNAELGAAVEKCTVTVCTVKEGLRMQNVTATLCDHKPRDRSKNLKANNIALMAIAAVFVLSRFAFKLSNLAETSLGLDDYFILMTILTGQPNTIVIDRGLLPNGLGRDIWTLSFEQITAFGKYFYWVEILYFIQITLLKMSFLFFYKRIFPGPTIQKVIWATILFNAVYGVTFVITGVFQCQPISFYWNIWDGEHTGRCINNNALVWANAAISVAIDLWMLAIPISQLVHLQLSRTKKMGVIVMFCLGAFATVVSVIRLQFVITFARTKNPTWDQQSITLWSTIEIGVAMVCSCIPSIRILLVRVLPRKFGSTQNREHRHQYNSSSGKISNKGFRSRKNSETEYEDKVIHYTKTFELNRGQKYDDEVELVYIR